MHMDQPLDLAAKVLPKAVPFPPFFFSLSRKACKSRMYYWDSKTTEAQEEMNLQCCFCPHPICLPGVSEIVGDRIS